MLKFKDTLSEDDHRNFNLIYESLLLEGRAGNLTNLTLRDGVGLETTNMVASHVQEIEAFTD